MRGEGVRQRAGEAPTTSRTPGAGSRSASATRVSKRPPSNFPIFDAKTRSLKKRVLGKVIEALRDITISLGGWPKAGSAGPCA
ncbi:O-antigen/lipopolysaccharide ABC transporter ATP-binding protein RfbE [Amycolatopsis vancoresmycina DSM 44592]|uniref:O-antigen/lipopolysaccharide ABC transporter ATP-binding protein RfbE n=1 Tax=Amycolatopsis vancoresmycina DSM 44592 TaxID=1292037 RepID=R1HZU7_9PSEU|nr:hypothetical protein [Amycolatopsis vancoresmycina]EOD63789.1 O-antigen/lipopolysaccharide ABC transporter ATP-binding protein RfbE [Amycolatopsis vancoresmycina DSM 44592]